MGVCSSYFFGTLKQITWDEFRDIFYSQHFFTLVKAKKKIEFLSLRQVVGMSAVGYQAKFFMLERFALGSFPSEREQATQSVSRLHINL